MRRVLERITAAPGVQPLRIFPLLLPVWAVHVKSIVRETQTYEVFDRYLSRAIATAGLRDPTALADFFAVEPALVERALRFLETIGHLRRDDGNLSLTEIGMRSVADGQRYVLKEDRQILYFDGFSGAPFPKVHYGPAGSWIDRPELTVSGVRFQPVESLSPFRIEAVADLARRSDREEFNLPSALTSVEPLDLNKVWLPAYVVECVSGLQVFVKAVTEADPYLQELLTPYLLEALQAEKPADDVSVWSQWLDAKGYPDAKLVRQPNRILRVSLPAEAFGTRMQWWQLGSFETRERTFLQLWGDEESRRRAVLARVSDAVTRRGVRDRAALEQRMAEISKQLEVTTPSIADLERYAREDGDEALAAMLKAASSR
jgi:hypothetical protein